MESVFFQKTEKKNKLKMDFNNQYQSQILNGINQLKTERKKRDENNLIPKNEYLYQTQSKNKLWGKSGNNSNQSFQQAVESHKVQQFQINKINYCDFQSIQKSNQSNSPQSQKHDSQSQSLCQIPYLSIQESKEQSDCIDQVSLFTFGKKSALKKKPLITSEIQFSQIIQKDYQVKFENMPKQKKKSDAFNPLLNLRYEDYQTRFFLPHEFQFHKLKEEDPFIAEFYKDSYEPDRIRLKKEIREEVMELMQINKGKYLMNVLLTRLLEQWMRVDQLEDYIEQQIKKFQPKKLLPSHQNQLYRLPEQNTIIFGLIQNADQEKELGQNLQKNELREFDIQDEDQYNFQTDQSSNQFFFSPEIEKKELFQLRNRHQINHELEIDLANPQQVYQYEEQCLNEQVSLSTLRIIQLNLQLESLCIQTQKYRLQIEAQSNHLKLLQQSLQSQTTQINQLQSTYIQLEKQFAILKQNTFLFVKTTIQETTHLSKRVQVMNNSINNVQNYNQEKLKQLFQHIFDVFYVELQILSSKKLRSISMNKNLKNHPKSRKKDNQSEALQSMYQLFIKSTSISDILKHFLQNNFISSSHDQIRNCLNTFDAGQDIINQTFQSLNQSKEAVIDYYQMIERYMKLFFCVKIKNNFISWQNKDVNSFISYLFHLLDTNSYHSNVTKEKFFSFSDQFIPYAFKVHQFLIKDLEINLTKVSKEKISQQSGSLKRQKKENELLSSVERMLYKQYENKVKNQQTQKIVYIFSKIIPNFDNPDELNKEKNLQSPISPINFVSKGKLKSKKLTSLIESLLLDHQQE